MTSALSGPRRREQALAALATKCTLRVLLTYVLKMILGHRRHVSRKSAVLGSKSALDHHLLLPFHGSSVGCRRDGAVLSRRWSCIF